MHTLLGNKTQYFIKICVKAFGVFVVVKMVDYCLMLNFAKMRFSIMLSMRKCTACAKMYCKQNCSCNIHDFSEKHRIKEKETDKNKPSSG